MSFCLNVSYSGNKHGWGSLDSLARKIAKRQECGSGTCLINMWRDVGFEFGRKTTLLSAINRFRKDRRFRLKVYNDGIPLKILKNNDLVPFW